MRAVLLFVDFFSTIDDYGYHAMKSHPKNLYIYQTQLPFTKIFNHRSLRYGF